MQTLARRLATSPAAPRPAGPVPIALVITDLDAGGAEHALVALATGLDRSRWAPAVVCLGPEGELAAGLRSVGIPTTCLAARRTRPFAALCRLVGTLRRHRPMLVQSFLFHANLAAKLAAPLAGRPWVLGGLRVAEREKRWHLRLDRLTQRMAAGSVCVSRGVARFARREGRLNRHRLAVIPNGIDVGRFDAAAPVPRRALGVPEMSVMALFVGRLERQKGLPCLLEALMRSVENPDLHLVAAGDGPDGDALRRMADGDDRLRGRVHWLGRRPDVPGLLATADLLVLPSLWEGMPNVVLEAMAARRAVVATAVEGTDELVIPGGTGWLVPPGDPAALAAALAEAAADPARCRAFGEAGRLRVARRYSQEAVIRAYDRLWSRVLGFEDSPAQATDAADR